MTTHSTADLELSDDVRESILRLAEKQKRSADEVLRDVLARAERTEAIEEAVRAADAGEPFVEWDDFKARARARIEEMKDAQVEALALAQAGRGRRVRHVRALRGRPALR